MKRIIAAFLFFNFCSATYYSQVLIETLFKGLLSRPAKAVSLKDKYKAGLYFGLGYSGYRVRNNFIQGAAYGDSLRSFSFKNQAAAEFGILLENKITNTLALRINDREQVKALFCFWHHFQRTNVNA